MRRVILLASRDQIVLRTRATLLQQAGFKVVSVPSLRLALSLISLIKPMVVILCQAFEVIEQEVFIDELHETRPSVHVICLRPTILDQPGDLLRACEQCFHLQPGRGIVRILPDINAKKAPAEYRIATAKHVDG